MTTRSRWLMAPLAAFLCPACGGAPVGDVSWPEGGGSARSGVSALSVRWEQQLTDPDEGPYVPVERARAALDPPADRVYVGSTAGVLYAMTSQGRRIYGYDTMGAIESAPALDRARGVLFVATEQGDLLSLRASDGNLLWRTGLGVPIRRSPVFSADAVYVVTENDIVIAFARSDGSELWRYRRDATEGFSVAGHAGLVLVDGKLLTASTDGVVIALDPVEGRLLWDRDTTVDLEFEASDSARLLDVDTTPVVIGDAIYAASFAGGLYALDAANGSVAWRLPELIGVTGLAPAGATLIAASAELGVLRLDLATHETVWRVPVGRGAPSEPVVDGNAVFVGESTGSMLVLRLDSGVELARIDAGHGFSAPATIASGFGVCVSNGGALYAFAAR